MGVNFSHTARAPSGHCSSADGSSTRRNASKTSDSEAMEDREEAPKDIGNESDDEFYEIQGGQYTPRVLSQEMVEFNKELAIKREQRKQILAKHAMQKENLRKSLELQIKSNQAVIVENNLLRDLLQQHNISLPQREYENEAVNALQGPVALMTENYENIKESNTKLRRDLADANLSLQSANSDLANLQCQNIEAMKQINALKEVVAVTKTMMKIRETQLNELKEKLSQIETSLADREASLLSTDLRSEYERQLQNIRNLRTMYEERARLADVTRLQLLRELDEQKNIAAIEANKCKELTEKVEQLEEKIVGMTDTIDTKDDQISVTKEETRGLKAEMSTVNQLFSQMLLGYKSQQDLDKLVSRLEEHHGLLTHMVVQDNGSEASVALPKLLLDLVGQIESSEGKEDLQKYPENVTENSLNTTAEEIVGNLPKVWRVLMELLSHQSSGAVDGVSTETSTSTCYKSVETPSGPRMVPSVSQTYIRLKDLIVEKLSLTKEMNKMKQLNVHLETRLEEQERRLCLVTSELSKTWHVVGRLRRHHHQLHTHEKILRYELQQKRKMLNELKEELEYCREKWDKAKEKNCESEKEWRSLRNEFSNRNARTIASINNSVESGYSDERQSEDDSTESNDESEYVNEPPTRCKKRIRKIVEIFPDSISDVNLVAEGEDPISDMLEVTELPLDGLYTEESTEKSESSLKESKEDCSTSETCASDVFSKSSTSLATISSKEVYRSQELLENAVPQNFDMSDVAGQSSTCDVYSPIHTPQEILENVRKQNERLAKRDEKLLMLEESSASLLKQVTRTAELRKRIDDRLQKIGTKTQEPCTSLESNGNDILSSGENVVDQSEELIDMEEQKSSLGSAGTEFTNAPAASITGSTLNIKTSESEINLNLAEFTQTHSDATSSHKETDPVVILENTRKQTQHLLVREEAMKSIEAGCSSILSTSVESTKINNDLENSLDITQSEGNLKKTPDQVHNYQSDKKYEDHYEVMTYNIVCENSTSTENIEPTLDAVEITSNNEPSSSKIVMDHEARFAARDERLKRLEEQTKSLVNKVNDTATKSVKITYKLEELHNIYGSEGGLSRNSSPSDDEPEEAKSENSTTDT